MRSFGRGMAAPDRSMMSRVPSANSVVPRVGLDEVRSSIGMDAALAIPRSSVASHKSGSRRRSPEAIPDGIPEVMRATTTTVSPTATAAIAQGRTRASRP
jgi:hypothetical protein